MRVVASKSLPRVWKTHPQARGIVLEKDLSVGHGRLRAKLLIFQDKKDLRHFWLKCLRLGDLSKDCLGAVNCLGTTHYDCSGKEERPAYIEVDPRYFCIIGLVKGYLSMEIISHESVHAGYAYALRKSKTPWDEAISILDEERVAYPSGRIAAAINRTIHAANLYEPHQRGTDASKWRSR